MNHNHNNTMKQTLLQAGVGNPSATLMAAVEEDSNHVADWLWYADQVENDAERRYCLQRTLYINPNNRIALDGLRELNKKLRTETPAAPLGWLARVWSRS